jgi:signal transduction histidine kinase/ActR/RegA family two-component response regulator
MAVAVAVPLSLLRRASRSGLARLLAGAAAVVAIGALIYEANTVATAPAVEVITLEQAQFVPAGAAPRDVTLPHTWARDGLSNVGRGLYRVEFRLAAAPAQPWGLQTPRLSSRHLIRLNGRWVHGSTVESASERGVPVPTWVDLAPDLLRAGDNLLEIEVAHDYRAGLSALHLGPGPLLWRAHVRDVALHVTVPRSLNLFGAGLALFIVTIWWRRRSERVLGLFAALMLLLSLRNVAYSGTGTVVHTPATDVLFYVANVGAAMLLARLSLAWAGRDWPAFRRTMDIGGTALIVAALGAVFFDAVQQMRVLTYPLVLASLVPSLVLMVRGTRQEAGATRVALLACVTMLCLAPLHDYFYIRGLTSVSDFYWMPFVAPIALIVFAWTLLDRFVGALAAVEGHAAELEQRVAQRTSELAEANAAKTRFLAAASHDLRQPLQALSLHSALLAQNPLAHDTGAIAGEICTSIDSLAQLLDSLLDISKLEAGVVTVERRPIRLHRLIAHLVRTHAPQACEKGLALRFECPVEAVVHTDPLLLERLLRNLLDNALKYTDEGEVCILAAGDEQVLQVSVRDSGRGIPEHAQAQVFEEFYQVDPPGDCTRGLGLGLAIVARLAALLELPLSMKSQPGQGTTVSLGIPRAAGFVDERLFEAPRNDALRGLRVLLIDDEEAVRRAMRHVLGRFGCEAAEAASSDEALERVESFAVQLVVADCRLRNGDSGISAIAHLRERLPGLPALLLSGDTDAARLREAERSGLRLLHKPVTLQRLQEAMTAAMKPSAAAAATAEERT